MTRDELQEKFRVNAAYSRLEPDRVEEIINTCAKLEELDDTAKLLKILTVV